VALDGNGLAALAKPEGTLSHPNGPGEESRALVCAPYDEKEECFFWTDAAGAVRKLWLINRLDSVTSGLILAATHEELARAVKAQFRQRQVQKVYQALVFGRPRQEEELWKDRLAVHQRGGHIRTRAGGGRLPAQSRMTLVRTLAGPPRLSLLQLEPHTGRSHQLRVQCAKRQLPIVGDRTYGNFAANKAFAKAGGPKRMFLHSLRTAFDYEFGGRTHPFAAEAPLPPEFSAFG
jgi:23S rRNA-/tRNA-specific pseudouridylate synthase